MFFTDKCQMLKTYGHRPVNMVLIPKLQCVRQLSKVLWLCPPTQKPAEATAVGCQGTACWHFLCVTSMTQFKPTATVVTLQHATSSRSAGPPEGLYGHMSGQKTAWKGLSGCQVSDPLREHHSPLPNDGATWQNMQVPGKVWEVRFCRFFFFF